jgi:hypothetical protein
MDVPLAAVDPFRPFDIKNPMPDNDEKLSPFANFIGIK